MKNITQTFAQEVIEAMKNFYKDQLETPPQGAYFRARSEGAVITAYQSGKVLFQGNGAREEFSRWEDNLDNSILAEHLTLNEKNNVNEKLSKQIKKIVRENHIGSDESGTGDYFGPVTACAVYIERGQIDTLKEIGIQDSKNISDQKIMQLAERIIKMEIPYSAMIIDNKKYNSLQKDGWSQGKMKALLHHSVIQSLLDKLPNREIDGIIIDQFCPEETYVSYLASENFKVHERTFFMTKAEDHSIAVATASILARAKFVQEMERLSNLVGMRLQKGASSIVDEVAAEVIKKHGRDVLDEIAKVHFANTKKAIALI